MTVLGVQPFGIVALVLIVGGILVTAAIWRAAVGPLTECDRYCTGVDEELDAREADVVRLRPRLRLVRDGLEDAGTRADAIVFNWPDDRSAA